MRVGVRDPASPPRILHQRCMGDGAIFCAPHPYIPPRIPYRPYNPHPTPHRSSRSDFVPQRGDGFHSQPKVLLTDPLVRRVRVLAGQSEADQQDRRLQ